MPEQMTVDGEAVPLPAEILISPTVLRPERSGRWRAVLVRMANSTTRKIGYVYMGDF